MRKNEYREIKKEIANNLRKHTRDFRKKNFEDVLNKGKVETYLDMFNLFDGLSKKAKDSVVLKTIIELVQYGKTAQEIVDILEVKK
jgi:hypothetical protein